jgi:hypothetical protein
VRIVRRVGAIAGLTLAGIVAIAAPAQAHPLRYGDDASNWRSTVAGVTPAGAVHASMGDGVLRLTVSLGTAHEATIEGYDGEPFVQLRPEGAFVNLRSSTTYAVKGSVVATPSSVDNKATPTWRRVSTTPSWSWHDTRTHWPGYTLPPPVEAAPNERQHVLDWRVGLTADGSRGAIAGTLDWLPGPSGGSGAAIAGASFLVIAGAFLRWRRARLVAGALLVLVATDAVHSVGMVRGRVGDFGSRVAALPGHGGLPLALWLLGLATAVLIARKNELGLYAAALLATLFCFTEALPSLAVLWRSQAVNALPLNATRTLVAVLTGASVATALAASMLITSHVRNPGGPA